MHESEPTADQSNTPEPDAVQALEDTLRWLRPWISEDALCKAFPTESAEAVRHTIAAAVQAGRVVQDARGWLRVNPIFRRPAPAAPSARARAAVAIQAACHAAPADLALQVARLSFVDWQSPDTIADIERLFDHARWGLRARELVDMLDDADLLGTLIEATPRAVLALLIEGGRGSQANPLIDPSDPYLLGLLAFQQGDLDTARTTLQGVDGLPAHFLRLEVYRSAFDYDALEAELATHTAPQLTAIQTLRRAYYRHRLVSYRGWWDQLPAAIDAMRAAAEATGDGSLQCRVVDAELARAIRMGDVPNCVARLSELERLVGEGWSPGLQSRLTLYHAFIADLAGDHLRLAAALARPFSGRSDSVFRPLQEAALHVMQGDAHTALASPAVQGVKGMEAQFLATVGRFEEALDRVDAPPPGFSSYDQIILRAPIDARLGRGTIIEAWPAITPFQSCKLGLSNTLVALANGDLDGAETWADHGLAIATQMGLWNLGAPLLLRRADIATQRGLPEDALGFLDRFDAVGRHPHCYLTNQATVARACLASTRPPDDFIDRLVQQHDRISLGILAGQWQLGDTAKALLVDLPEVTRIQLQASFATPRAEPTLTLRAEGRWVDLPDGSTVDLRRSGAPRRLLVALAQRRLDCPGRGIDADALVSIGWPGESMHWESARARLYTVIRRLRARGVVGLETVDGGYRLSPEISVQLEGSFSSA